METPPKTRCRFSIDGEAWAFLKAAGYTCDGSVITLPKHKVTEDEQEALDYLRWEWGYSF